MGDVTCKHRNLSAQGSFSDPQLLHSRLPFPVNDCSICVFWMPKYTFIIPIRLLIVKQTSQIAPSQPQKPMYSPLHLLLPPLYYIPGVPLRLFRKKARAIFTPQIPPIQPRQKFIKRVDTFNKNNPGNISAARSAAVKVNNTPTQPPFAQPLSFIIHPAAYPLKGCRYINQGYKQGNVISEN